MSQGARTRNFLTQPHSSLITPREASPAFRIGEHYSSVEETLAKVGYGPNRQTGQQGAPLRRVA